MSTSCTDHNSYSPLISGIGVINGRRGDQGFMVGTIGFFATINGIQGPDNVVLVTNHHVLEANGGRKKDDVYQPDTQKSLPNNLVAETLSLPEKADHKFAYPGEAELLYFVDCASAQLKIRMSSCCNTNCGVTFANRVRLLSIGESNAITGIARAKKNEIVYKVGYESGLTEGRIKKIDLTLSGAGVAATNVIEIEPTQPNCDGVMRFSHLGDSGAPIINQQGQLVGLLYSAALTNQNESLACHIHPVLDALKVTAITKANPPLNNKAFITTGDIGAVLDARPDPAEALRQRFLATPTGQRIAPLVDRHGHEIVHLVNHNRRVTLAWQRHQGPAFVNRAINNARDPASRIPTDIKGITAVALLGTMGDVLSEHGSPALRADIAAYRHEVLAYAAACGDLHELVDRLERTAGVV